LVCRRPTGYLMTSSRAHYSCISFSSLSQEPSTRRLLCSIFFSFFAQVDDHWRGQTSALLQRSQPATDTTVHKTVKLMDNCEGRDGVGPQFPPPSFRPCLVDSLRKSAERAPGPEELAKGEFRSENKNNQIRLHRIIGIQFKQSRQARQASKLWVASTLAYFYKLLQ